MNNDDPFIDPEELRLANERCDAELRRLGFDVNTRIRPGFNPNLVLRNGPLTDRKIERYQKDGYYSEEYRAFRKEHMNRQKPRRIGNYTKTGDRLIYSP